MSERREAQARTSLPQPWRRRRPRAFAQSLEAGVVAALDRARTHAARSIFRPRADAPTESKE